MLLTGVVEGAVCMYENLYPSCKLECEFEIDQARIYHPFLFASMATNAGAGAARQLQSARTATAVWKVSYDSSPRRYGAESSRSTLFSRMAYGNEFGELLLLTLKGRLGSL